MKKLILLLALCSFIKLLSAQEFPIATDPGHTLAIRASFDGTNYMVPIKGDVISPNNATAQFISTTGSLVGPRILIGASVASIFVLSAFDGTNYLLAWATNTKDIVGQFLSPNGSLVGSQFTIATNVEDIETTALVMAYNAGSYLICYLRGFVFGQRVGTNGALLGSEFQISTSLARELSMAFDGTNYLISYVHDTNWPNPNNLLARFVNPTGVLVGSEITVASGSFHRDNPISSAFDGTRYLLAYHEQPTDPPSSSWFIRGRFIDINGNLENIITIRDSIFNPFLPMVAFGNNHYLVTYTQNSNGVSMGQWYTVAGVPNGSPFVILEASNNKIPYGAPIFANNNFLAIITRMGANFSEGDVYGKFVGLPTAISDMPVPTKFQIYPNPASSFIRLNTNGLIVEEVKIYKTTGELVVTVKNFSGDAQIDVGYLSPGIYVVEIKTGRGTEMHKLAISR